MISLPRVLTGLAVRGNPRQKARVAGVTDMESIECVVIGAGVVGLACARALAMSGREVIILEATGLIGSETSSRNSEVIHAGIYYPPGSLKARACVQGRQRLYSYCEQKAIPHRRCEKLIVATDESQLPGMAALLKTAHENGVPTVEWMDEAEILKLEPALRCTGGLRSRETGIIDSHAYMLALLGDIESCGGAVAFESRVAGWRVHPQGGAVLEVVDASGTNAYHARTVVNCAGLHAARLLGDLEGFNPVFVPETHYAKGSYFSFTGRSPFERLIYPAPESAGLGVHATMDMGGQLKFGPDVEWTDVIDYSVDPRRADGFYVAIRRYWPDLPDDSLAAAYAGIRPKLVGEGRASADFRVEGPRTHGATGIVNMLGIESPGLTSSLVLGDLAAAALKENA